MNEPTAPTERAEDHGTGPDSIDRARDDLADAWKRIRDFMDTEIGRSL
jgi:hypothetical protein